MNLDNENELYNNIDFVQNQERDERKKRKKKKKSKNMKTYTSFIFLFILNISMYISFNYYNIKISQFSISLFPILIKLQFYKLIAHHFIHYGIFHLLLELLFTFYICKYLEKMIGTLYTFSLIFVMIIMTSIIYILIVFLFKIIGKIIDINYNGDFMFECGMSSLLFSLYSYIVDFKKNKNKLIKLLNFAAIRMRYSSFYILIALSLFTPNKTFLGNLCGIISAYIVKNIFGCSILPKYIGVYDFEYYFSLSNHKSWYVSIIDQNQDMKELFIEIFTDIDFDSQEQKQEQLGIQMKEIDDSNEP